MKRHAAILIVMLSCTGCASNSPKDQTTPEELLQKWHEAALKGDEASASECYYPRQDQYEKLAAAECAYVKSVYNFEDSLKSHHGDDSWDRLWSLPVGGFKPVVPSREADWVRGLKFEMAGDKGVVHIYADVLATPLKLVKKGGAWYLDFSEVKNPDDYAALFRSWKEMFDGLTIELDANPKITLEQLRARIND